MSRQAFHHSVAQSLFKGSLPTWQKEPLDRLLDEGARRGRSIQDVAYVMATAYHETGRFKYDSEIGEGSGRDYGEPIWLIRGVRVAYFGRGMVQLTWLQNYAKMSVFLTLEHQKAINLVTKPELASEPEWSSLIIWEGMVRGMFTGRNLADFTNDEGILDYVAARKIVNGTDRDDLIAGYARKFETGLALIDDEPAPSGCPIGVTTCPRNGAAA